ncbi:Eukaryotic translation initiation factor 2 subunit 3-like protein [Drosera capensis]
MPIFIYTMEKTKARHLEQNTWLIYDTVASDAPVIPVCAQLGYNMDVVCEYIAKKIPVPERDFVSPPFMRIIRSIDVNKPGAEIKDMKGGVVGGSILKGVFKVNQKIEIRPGIIFTDTQGKKRCQPLYSRITSLYAEENELQIAVPGGLIGVGTTMDSSLTHANQLVGLIVGEVGSLPDVNYFLLRQLLGVEAESSERSAKVARLIKGEMLLVNIGSMAAGAEVIALKRDLAKLRLIKSAVCASKGEKIALSRRFREHWRLIGWARFNQALLSRWNTCLTLVTTNWKNAVP